MKKAQMMMLAVGTGLFLISCGGAGEEKSTDYSDSSKEETSSGDKVTVYNIDPEASKLQWSGTMMGMYSHSGTLNIKGGSITVSDGVITSGEVEVDMATINPTDDNYKEDSPKEKLVDHLTSGQFFDLENHPTASVQITNAEGGIGMVDLTIRGITNNEELSTLKFEEVDGTFDGKGELTFDRTKYEVSFVHPMEEMVISNDIVLSIQLKGTAK